MKKQKLLRNLNSKGRYLTLLLTVTAGLLYCSSAWAGKGFWSSQAWNLQYYDGDGGDKWLNNDGYDMGSTQDLGVKTILYLKGTWVKTWSNDSWATSFVRIYYNVTNDTEHDYKFDTSSDLGDGNRLWTLESKLDYNLIEVAPNNPGQNTMAFHYNVDDWDQGNSSTCYLNFTIPGFDISTADDVNLGEVDINGSGKVSDKIEFHHYGEQPTKAQCSFNGTGKEYYSIESIDWSGVTVKYKPAAGGQHNVTLTITDKYSTSHSTFTVNLKGSGVTAYTPTVLIAGKETVLDTEVTLNGYIKYTGCKNVTEYGFVYDDESSEPTTSNNKVIAGTTGAKAGYSYSQEFDVMDNGTYNYRAYMKAGGTTYYSAEVRQFTIESDCPYYPTPKPELTLNGYVDNVICLDESVVAKCVSKPGFKYKLFGPDSNPIGVEEREGDGSTLVWQKDDALKAAGTYILKTKEVGATGERDCWAISAKATQAINSATMTIEAENDNPYAYQPVIIKKSAGQDEFTKPTWEIKTAESGAYLLNYENKLIYSGKQVDKVLFKGNATGADKQVEVSAAAYKTVEFEGGEKTCPAVVEPITITVKPADEVCD